MKKFLIWLFNLDGSPGVRMNDWLTEDEKVIVDKAHEEQFWKWFRVCSERKATHDNWQNWKRFFFWAAIVIPIVAICHAMGS